MPSRTANPIPWVHALRMPRRLSYGKLIDAILAMHAYGLDVLDVLADFRRAEASGSRLYGSVDLHLSPERHDLVGPAVVARLSRPTRRVSVMPAFSDTPR